MRENREGSNELVFCLFIPSFFLYMRGCGGSMEDTVVRPWERLVPTVAAAVPGFCVKCSQMCIVILPFEHLNFT
jgi:hypothetical protein